MDDLVWGKLATKGWPPKPIRDPARFLPKKFSGRRGSFHFSAEPGAVVGRIPASASLFSAPLAAAYGSIAPFRTINGYGLFAVMTKERREILVQGSEDGVTGKHMLSVSSRATHGVLLPGSLPTCRGSTGKCGLRLWERLSKTLVLALSRALARGFAAVSDLLEENPFLNNPPRFVRALSDRYTFTTMAEGRRTGTLVER